MTLYAAAPLHRLRQVVGDLVVATWVATWAWLGTVVHDATRALAVPGREIDEAATGLADRLRTAGERVGDLPLVGDDVRTPFDGAGGAADQLAAAGRAQADAVEVLAVWLGLAVALAPVLLALGLYLPARIRFVRRAAAGRRLLDSAADLDLFALRALAHQPLHVLARISDDPARAWRERDPDVIAALAEAELRGAGLRSP